MFLLYRGVDSVTISIDSVNNGGTGVCRNGNESRSPASMVVCLAMIKTRSVHDASGNATATVVKIAQFDDDEILFAEMVIKRRKKTELFSF